MTLLFIPFYRYTIERYSHPFFSGEGPRARCPPSTGAKFADYGPELVSQLLAEQRRTRGVSDGAPRE
jgi:hypothetical protein